MACGCDLFQSWFKDIFNNFQKTLLIVIEALFFWSFNILAILIRKNEMNVKGNFYKRKMNLFFLKYVVSFLAPSAEKTGVPI